MTTSRPPDADPPTGHAVSSGLSVGRLEAFSDGVFAIVITLLVLDLPRWSDGTRLAATLGENWATYLAYLASFLVAGTIWLNHHATFRLVHRTTYRLQVLNLLLLLPVSVLPWPTELIADAARDGTTADQRVAVLLYGGAMIALAIAFQLLWRYLIAHPELHQPWVTPQLLSTRHRRYLLGLPVYAVVTLLGLLSLPLFLAVMLAMAVLYLLPTPDMEA